MNTGAGGQVPNFEAMITTVLRGIRRCGRDDVATVEGDSYETNTNVFVTLKAVGAPTGGKFPNLYGGVIRTRDSMATIGSKGDGGSPIQYAL